MILGWSNALSTGLLRRFSGILVANAVNNLVSFTIILFAARTFGPELFGVFALAISITMLLSMLLDFGSNVALVRLYNIENSPDVRHHLVRVVLTLKVAFLVLFVPLPFVLQSATASLFPIAKGHEGLIYLSFISGALLSFWVTMRAVEQASRDFLSIERYTFAYALLRAVCATAVLLTGFASITTVFVSLYAAPLVGLLVLWWFTRYRTLLQESAGATEEPEVKISVTLRKIFAYGAWVAVSGLCYAGLLRLPQFFLANEGAAEETGLYSAALTFLAVFVLMNDALRTVILPDVSALSTSSARREFRRRFAGLSPIFFAVMAIVILAMASVQYFILGGDYRTSVTIFIVLGVAVVITMYLGVFNTLVHSYGVPKLEATNNVLRLIALALILWILHPTAMNASLAFGLTLIAGELRIYMIIRDKISRPDVTSP